MKTHGIGLFRDRLTHHMRTDTPGPGMASGEMLFQGPSYTVRRMIKGTESGKPGGIPAQEIGVFILLMKVPETGDIRTCRAPAVSAVIGEPVVLRGNVTAIIVKSDVFAEQPVVIAKSVRETDGSGV